jgi:septal ring factor EnvC (AmiA/AmiB activator)
MARNKQHPTEIALKKADAAVEMFRDAHDELVDALTIFDASLAEDQAQIDQLNERITTGTQHRRSIDRQRGKLAEFIDSADVRG